MGRGTRVKNAANVQPFKMHALQATRAKTPRFVFRGTSRCSSGHIGLDDKTGIRPFVTKGTREMHKTIYDITALSEMVNSYRKGNGRWAAPSKARGTTLTEFTSWTPSLADALSYMSDHPVKEEPFLAILDAARLPPGKIYSVKEMELTGVIKQESDNFHQYLARDFHHEYLVHGSVEGDCYILVPLKELKVLGLFVDRRPIDADIWLQSPEEVDAVTLDQAIDHALSIGTNVGNLAHDDLQARELAVWFSAAVLSLKYKRTLMIDRASVCTGHRHPRDILGSPEFRTGNARDVQE